MTFSGIIHLEVNSSFSNSNYYLTKSSFNEDLLEPALAALQKLKGVEEVKIIDKILNERSFNMIKKALKDLIEIMKAIYEQ